MAFTFDHDYHTWATDDEITAARLNQGQTGIQNWCEAVNGYGLLNGVVSGLTITVNDTTDTVTVASGTAIAAGKRITGTGTYTFTNEAGAPTTYYVYLDASDEASPLKVSTSDQGNTGNYVTLGSVAWTLGTTTLASPKDRRILGVRRWHCLLQKTGTLAATNVVGRYVAEKDLTIEGAYARLEETGATSGQTEVDIEVAADGSTTWNTVFDTAANRPIILYTAADGSMDASGHPDADDDENDGTSLRFVSAGMGIRAIIDAIPGTASQEATVVIYGRER